MRLFHHGGSVKIETDETEGEFVVRKRSGVERCLRRLLCAGFLAFALLALAAPSGAADDYDPKEAGHPLRIAAYALHPVGVILDTLIFRPAYWLGSHEPLRTLFGRTD
jgi:hypothetical protein